jgi:hypothetical protein
MQTIEYKGFSIAEIDGKFYVHGAAYMQAKGIRADGYPTMNHAKGAITKALKAAEATEAAEEKALQDTTSATLETGPSGIRWTNERNPQGHRIAADKGFAKAYAEMDYYGFKEHPSDKRSRRQREGRKFVKVQGRFVRSSNNPAMNPEPNNRKQRKKLGMDFKNSTRQYAYGGAVKGLNTF